MTAEDFNASEDYEFAVPADLDEKMGRIQFLFDRIMDVKGGLMSLLSTHDQESIDSIYSIGDKDNNGKLSR